MTRTEVHEMCKAYGVKLWEVADVLGICDTTLTRWIRRPMDAERTAQVREAIIIAHNRKQGEA